MFALALFDKNETKTKEKREFCVVSLMYRLTLRFKTVQAKLRVEWRALTVVLTVYHRTEARNHFIISQPLCISNGSNSHCQWLTFILRMAKLDVHLGHGRSCFSLQEC